MNSQKYASLAFPLVVVTLTGIYAYWAAQRELVSSRPSLPGQYSVPDPVPTPGTRTFHSRLWEDPLSTSYERWKALPMEQRAPDESPVQEQSVQADITKAIAERIAEPERDADGEETRENDEQIEPRRLAMKLLLQRLVGSKDTLCLPVFLPGGPYAEDIERRMRIRYAVVTGLAESGYALKYNRRMSFVTSRIYVRVLWGWQAREVVVPIKLYKTPVSTKPQVLVLWINESDLGLSPLLATHRILNDLFERVDHPARLTLAMVGPTSSGTLVSMSKEIEQLNDAAKAYLAIKAGESVSVADESEDWRHWLVRSYAPRVECIQGLAPLLSPSDGATIVYSPRATKEHVDFPSSDVLTFRRVIGTDRDLAAQVRKELKLRGAADGRIVLITEHDTAYGRAIRNTYEEEFASETPRPEFYEYRILRGIDGELPSDAEKVKAPSSQQSGDAPATADATEIVERPPEGRTQYDYLRRLRSPIEQLGDVKAIGVVGSDVYDKLLVLRALKPHFPDCVFFTSDLDAIYTHPNERQHTRNLIVASHFDLRLNGERLQTKTPPFRDSYQTATFLATRLAVTKKSDREAWTSFGYHRERVGAYAGHVEPLASVIGGERLRRLTSARNGKVHPAATQDTSAWHFLFVVGFTLFATCGVLLLVRRDRILDSPLLIAPGDMRAPSLLGLPLTNLNGTIMVLLGVGVLLVVWFSVRGHIGPEAAPFFAGYSSWPRKLLYALTGVFAVLTFSYLIDQFFTALKECDEHRSDSSICHRAPEYFGRPHLLKIFVLAITMCSVGALAVYHFLSPFTLTTVAGCFACLGAAWRYGSTFDNEPAPDPTVNSNLVLGHNTGKTIRNAFGLMIVATIVAAVAESGYEGTNIGWYPTSTSRGLVSRFGDWLAVVYAFGMIGLVFASMLYSYFWCWEFSRHVRKYPQDFQPEQPGSESSNEPDFSVAYDRLWFISKVTSVPSKVAPALMALLLVLVLAYHPLLSPTPMPLSLLALTTLSSGVLIGAAVLMRWHFQRERMAVLGQLQDQIWEVGGLADTQFAVPLEDLRATSRAPTSGLAVATESPGAAVVESALDLQQLMLLELRKKQIESLSDGVFQPWSRSPIGWILGGGASLAIADLWVRWWSIL